MDEHENEIEVFEENLALIQCNLELQSWIEAQSLLNYWSKNEIGRSLWTKVTYVSREIKYTKFYVKTNKRSLKLQQITLFKRQLLQQWLHSTY